MGAAAVARWAVLSVVAMLAGCMAQSEPPRASADVAGALKDEPPRVGDVASAQQADASAPEPVGALAPTFALNATDCTGLVLLHIEGFGSMQRHLPAGFVPADIMDLVKLGRPMRMGQGAMGLVVVDCAKLDLALPIVAVQAPHVVGGPGPAYLDLYALESYTDDEAAAAQFSAIAWNVHLGLEAEVAGGGFDAPEASNVTRVPDVRFLSMESRLAGKQFAAGGGQGGPRYHTSDAGDGLDAVRLWHDTPHGLAHVDIVLDRHGTSGRADCTYGSEHLREVFGHDSCAEGSSISILLPTFAFMASGALLPGVHA